MCLDNVEDGRRGPATTACGRYAGYQKQHVPHPRALLLRFVRAATARFRPTGGELRLCAQGRISRPRIPSGWPTVWKTNQVTDNPTYPNSLPICFSRLGGNSSRFPNSRPPREGGQTRRITSEWRVNRPRHRTTSPFDGYKVMGRLWWVAPVIHEPRLCQLVHAWRICEQELSARPDRKQSRAG